jgi:Subtilisin inhibitor-like
LSRRVLDGRRVRWNYGSVEVVCGDVTRRFLILGGVACLLIVAGLVVWSRSKHAPTTPPARLTLVSSIVPKCGRDSLCFETVAHRYTLRCDPASGTMPNPAAACAALYDLESHYADVGPYGTCIGPLQPNPSTAALGGTYNGRPFHLKLQSNSSWCGLPKPVLRDYWVLSAFPCTVGVLHVDDGSNSYADWARQAGCDAWKTGR